MNQLRVVLVDDHPVVRAGLRALLEQEPDIVVVGEAASASDGVAVVGRTEPDVVLMDLNLGGGGSGIDAISELMATGAVRVLVLTTYDTQTDISRCLDAGALGYLLKDCPPDELFAGIRAGAKGQTVFAPAVAETIVRRATGSAITITSREATVLELLARGLGNREIAQELFVSEATVKSHLAHIYDKLAVQTRAGAVAAAIEQRIIRS